MYLLICLSPLFTFSVYLLYLSFLFIFSIYLLYLSPLLLYPLFFSSSPPSPLSHLFISQSPLFFFFFSLREEQYWGRYPPSRCARTMDARLRAATSLSTTSIV